LAGLDENGLTILRLPEVVENIQAAERVNIDPDINTQDDELLGQLNNIIAAAISEQWALAQAVNDNFNPLVAEGKNLDDIASIIGIVRIGETKSSTDAQQFSGDEGSAIATDTVVQNPNSLDTFITTTLFTLTIAQCLSGTITVQTVLNNTLYTVLVNGTQYDFTSDGDATESEILTGLKAAIDADVLATWTATISGSDFIIATTDTNTIAITGLVTMVPSKATANTTAESTVFGPIAATSNSVTTIVTAITGVDSTTNVTAYVVGRDTESDEDFRERILVSQQTAGAGTVPAIFDAVANVAGVSSVQIIENRTFAVDGDGRPPKSFETIVQGGADAAVAQTIWDTKPAGIETFGNTTESVADSSGDLQDINFTRPTIVNMAYRVTYSKYSEESFPASGESTMQTVLVTQTADLGVDVDVIPTRFFGPIYAAVDGIDTLLIEQQVLASSGDAPVGGSWTTVTQAIDFDEFAGTAIIDITFIAL